MAEKMDNTLLKDCAAYFRENKGFVRLFQKMREKYKSLGHAGGTVVLQNLTRDEKEALEGLLKRDLSSQKSVTIKLDSIQRSINSTRYGGLDLESILNAYFGEKLTSNREEQQEYERKREDFFRQFTDRFADTPAGQWLEYALESKKNAYTTLVQRYDSSRAELEHELDAICRAVNKLPAMQGRKLRLPVFASMITRDPHAFDSETSGGQLLQYGLTFLFGTDRPSNAEARSELYYAAGILHDEVSSYVLCSGLRGFAEDMAHPGWEGFYMSTEALLVNVTNLSGLDRVISPFGKVFIVENPGVFASIKDEAREINIPLICTFGQLRVASLMLLDMLAAENTLMFYSGDFDPEGLLISDKLAERYGDRLLFWHYDVEDYKHAVSEKKISPASLKKLDKLKSPEMVKLGEVLRQNAYAGYQELLLYELVTDVKRMILHEMRQGVW